MLSNFHGLLQIAATPAYTTQQHAACSCLHCLQHCSNAHQTNMDERCMFASSCAGTCSQSKVLL